MTSLSPKHALREQFKAVRAKASGQHGDDGIRGFFEHLLKTWAAVADGYGHEVIMAGYWPMASEMDVRPALVALDRIGVLVTLPEVVAQDRSLRFRAWRPDEPLVEGSHGTYHPLTDAPLMRPDIVLVPLLAFDRRGFRLGWGGGYYDRTLERLRKTGTCTAIGVAYSAQEVDEVPTDSYDQRLDWIITEKEAINVT
ncbi:5-formyltetrahydrofolate cyclo-ligase [Magnetovibrio blakemorei]|uniref:5-formyltetrahydrofolate cyclo-ligase n=1 Tax=Magnetovibrio blakemorei TaxID=28181 RepID=A0A1E5QA46_9PROT|nr:5-formyltetrahydrofolate cyclo-ligase [Magnetovibrio blakemorei]OEJ68676.1 5-formyltetrahydrofolate cyclo-ligase [Magnetovibrio blakemorei]